MAHKTLINGTAYEITGGKTLVGGTAYEITGGKTLVDGTVRDIEFGDGNITFTILRSESWVTYGPFEADEGMTWSQFINSKYNKNGFFSETSYGTACYDDGSDGFWITYNGTFAMLSDVIVDGRVYEGY
jgi:hypothetical protein